MFDKQLDMVYYKHRCSEQIVSQTNARVAQLVERDLAKVEAAGSSPVSRSSYLKGHPSGCLFILSPLLRYLITI